MHLVSEKRIVVWVQHFADRPFLMLQWHDPATGKRKSRSAETNNPLDAERRRADLEYELNNGLHREPSRMTWERFRGLFEAEYLPGARYDTRRNYGATFDLFERLCNPSSLRSVTERTVSAFVAAMRKEPGRRLGSAGMMESSVKVRLQFLHTALQWAVGQKLLPAVPAFPPVRPPKKRPQPVPAESFEKLLEKAGDDAQLRAFLLCGWLAGLRLSEAYALEWEESDAAPWVDLGRGRVVLPAAVVKAVEDQWVPLDDQLREALLALPRRGRRVFHFRSQRSERLSVNGLSTVIQKLAKRAGLRLTMKSLRRGFGCYYAARVPAQALQKLMRHANIKTTIDYYVNVDDVVEDAVRRRNSSRNKADAATPKPPAGIDATPSPDSASPP
jgi:integrase